MKTKGSGNSRLQCTSLRAAFMLEGISELQMRRSPFSVSLFDG